MNVIILAGGFGTRLKSEVDGPKVLAPVNGIPFLEYTFDYLERFNVAKVVLSLGFLSEVIINWAKTQNRKFSIDYVIENSPLGTGGGIKLALEKVSSDSVIVLNGDTFFNIDLNKLSSFQNNSSFEMSIALKPLENFDRYGNVLIDDKSQILSFEEKKYCSKGQINAGFYAISDKNIFKNYPDVFSIEKDYLTPQAKAHKIGGVFFDEYFIDIGIPSDYQKVQNDFRTMFDKEKRTQ